MWVCPKHRIAFLALTLGLFISSGCTGHEVRTGTNSEGDGLTSTGDTPDMKQGKLNGDGMISRAYGSDFGNGRDGGTVDGANPYLRSGHGDSADSSHSNRMDPSASNGKGIDPGKNSSGSVRANYGMNYSGVEGSGPNHGSVSGFGDGVASRTNPDPESWANAYLGKGHNNQDFYGDPSKAGKSRNGMSNGSHSMNPAGMDPSTWAENYARENGGPSPEYVDPDMNIAHASSQAKGGPFGMGKSRSDESVFGSHRDDTMGRSDSMSMSNSMGMSYEGQVQDIYFAFDSWSISSDAAKYLQEGAEWLHANPGKALTIEGHCDQRGTQDYNLVLGQKRAEAAKDYLINLGVQPSRIKIVSYGKERPFCQADSEDCFQENRRNHMVVRVN